MAYQVATVMDAGDRQGLTAPGAVCREATRLLEQHPTRGWRQPRASRHGIVEIVPTAHGEEVQGRPGPAARAACNGMAPSVWVWPSWSRWASAVEMPWMTSPTMGREACPTADNRTLRAARSGWARTAFYVGRMISSLSDQ